MESACRRASSATVAASSARREACAAVASAASSCSFTCATAASSTAAEGRTDTVDVPTAAAGDGAIAAVISAHARSV
ncbi:hypothetical protein DBR36_11430 [Microbacterium sp. HMWF026]|nr:hypothetical protein DBR36_11430 [Microbacterium sp. HMWF026]